MTRPFRLGLTGSIGMGKSTTAGLFAEQGIPVWDADAAVARLYAPGGAGVAAVSKLCPNCVEDDTVDRERLRAWLEEDPARFAELETAIHPLVARDRERFLDATKASIVLLDIPLLFETGAEAQLDAVVVVSAPPDIQRERVLKRAGMTPERFSLVLGRQVSDAEKRRRADYVIETLSLEDAAAGVQDVLRDIREKLDA